MLEQRAVQTELIRAIHKISWDAQLWFPVVQRQLLGLRTEATDEEIQTEILKMIKEGALVLVNPYLPYTWEVAGSNECAYSDRSLRKVSTSAASELALKDVLSSLRWVDEVITAEEGQGPGVLGSDIDVSYLESQIILAIDHLGWFAFLWFPVVDHDSLNFGSHAPEGEVFRAFRSLIRKRALVPIHEEPGDRPDWQPSPDILRTAIYRTSGRRI